MARQTVEICDAGFYVAPSGQRVDLVPALCRAKKETVIYSPEKPPPQALVAKSFPSRVAATNETTFAALARLARSGDQSLGCLNFASAKNPGGGFLNGAMAQEEALACASGLYPCLLEARAYYDRNRARRCALYLDQIIFSPRVPFFRDDDGFLLEQPIFYPVLNEEYARQIARDWNVRDSGAGYVTRFAVRREFRARFATRTVGSLVHQELWIPAEDLAEMNRNIVGFIEVVAEFKPGSDM